jgi:hypothetical protein
MKADSGQSGGAEIMVPEGSLAHRIGDREEAVSSGGVLWMPRQIPHTIASGAARRCRFLSKASTRCVTRPRSLPGLSRTPRPYRWLIWLIGAQRGVMVVSRSQSGFPA